MDPFFATGHINAFQVLGEWLFNAGYRVVFICPIHYNGTAISNNFEYFHLSPFLFLPDKLELKQKGFARYFLDNVFGSRYNRAYQTFKIVASDYDKVIKETKPNLILLDDHHAYKAHFYQKYRIKIASVSTMTLPLMTTKSPPFQSTYIPSDTKVSLAIIKYLWIKNYFKRYIKDRLEKIRCLENSDLSLMKSFCPDSRLTLDMHRSLGVGISEIPMIATYPKPLDFHPHFFNKQVLFFGEISETSKSKISDNRLLSILHRTNSQDSNSGMRRIIYCSMGTVTIDFLSVCHSFFKKISIVAALNPSIEFILSVGKQYDINKLGVTPPNVSVFSFVPQAELLKSVDLMINHGGLNTIKECIREGVPMVVYPLSLDWDQPGNAARVVYHKLGLMGKIRKDSVKQINKKIQSIMGALDTYKANVQSMLNCIKEANVEEEKKIMSFLNDNINK